MFAFCSPREPTFSLQREWRAMRNDRVPGVSASRVRLRLGRWLEISGAGWGVMVAPALLALLAWLVAARG